MKYLQTLTLITLTCLATLTQGAEATHSPDHSNDRLADLKGLGGYILTMSVLNGIGSQNPRAYGNVMIGIAPLAAIFATDAPSSTWKDAVAAGGVLAGFGLYNRNVLSRDEYSTSEVFRRDMLITTTPVLIGVAYSALFGGGDKTSAALPVDIGYDGDTAMLWYSRRW